MGIVTAAIPALVLSISMKILVQKLNAVGSFENSENIIT